MKKNSSALWERLSDRTKLPRRLWYPPAPVDIYDAELWQKQFDVVSNTVRRSMFGLLAYAAFCLVALGQPDSELFREAAVQLPVVNTKVSIAGFMLIGPLVLVVLSAYLHIFIGRWAKMTWGKSMDSLSPPYIFNLPDKSAVLISAFLFYWLTPIVLAAFVYKGQPYTDFDLPILWSSLVVTTMLVLLAIRRCPSARRKWQNPVLWLALLVLFGSITFDRLGSYDRGLDLSFADLSEKSLRYAKLRAADFSFSDLSGADLTDADLKYADFFSANLSEATLTRADLEYTEFWGANLSEATLTNANLRDARLMQADLTGANLTGADLAGAYLIRAIGLNCEQLTAAENWDSAFRDSELACGEPNPEPPVESTGNK